MKYDMNIYHQQSKSFAIFFLKSLGAIQVLVLILCVNQSDSTKIEGDNLLFLMYNLLTISGFQF